MKKSHIATVAAMATVAAITSACGSSTGTPAGSSSKEVTILAIVSTTGPTELYGTQQLAGLKAAVAYFNSHGGFDGAKAQVTTVNSNGDPATATSLAIKALSSGSYTMVYPGDEGTVIDALVPIMKRYQAYSIVNNDGDGVCETAANCPTEFSLDGNTAIPEGADGAFMKSLGVKNVGILEEAINFTQSETQPMVNALNAAGIKSEVVSFPSTAVDLSAEMSQLKSDGAQAVFAEALGPAAGYALQGRQQLSWSIPVLFDLAGSAQDITTLAPASQLHDAYETVANCADPQENIPAFTWLQHYATGLAESVPCNNSGLGWDSVALLREAIEQAHSTSPAGLVKVTEHLDSAAQSDPDYLAYPMYGFSASNHENIDQTLNMFKILPVSPIVDTRLK
jgi:ABC-type branched-subunit amino acid transport system substrate-binding protein